MTTKTGTAQTQQECIQELAAEAADILSQFFPEEFFQDNNWQEAYDYDVGADSQGAMEGQWKETIQVVRVRNINFLQSVEDCHCAFPAKVQGMDLTALYDTCATQSVMSQRAWKKLPRPGELRPATDISVVSARGTSLGPLGYLTLSIHLENHVFPQEVLVCKGLRTPLILGNDMQRKYQLSQGWVNGHFTLSSPRCALVNALSRVIETPLLKAEKDLTVPPHCVLALETVLKGEMDEEEDYYKVVVERDFCKRYPLLFPLPMCHRTGGEIPKAMPVVF